MSKAQSFSAVASTNARILILGSMPGKQSLLAQEYYANPRNAFWHIMESLIGISSKTPYKQRLAALTAHNIALWDVLETCYRPSSLDADIDKESMIVNKFEQFYNMCPDIRAIFFNGLKAQQVYSKYVVPNLPENLRDLYSHCLPSTSPANARLSLSEKTEQWRIVHHHIKQA